MRIVWFAKAEGDLAEIFDFILQDNPTTALRVIHIIRSSTKQLSAHPHSGRQGRVKETQELIIPGIPYIIVYYITNSEIRIIAVLHTSRKWPNDFSK